MILMDCNNAVLGNILYTAKNILNIIWLAGPILAIISLIINFAMLVKDPEDKKVPKKIKNSIIALVVLFMIPTIVNVAMRLADDNTEISACWNQDIEKPSYKATYIDPNPGKRKSILSDPGGYEYGKPKTTSSSSSDNVDVSDTSCGELEYCNKFLTSMVNNSKRLNDAIVKNNAPVDYNYGKSKRTWAAAIKAAERGELVATTCVVPANWGVSDVIGSHKFLNSVGYGGFENYSGKITQYTKQYKFDGSTSFKTAIQKGMIKPGDIIGVKAHTFAVYSVNQSTGSAVVFDGGHQFTTPCQKKRKCSPMINYSANNNAGYRLYQIIRWVK